MSRATAYVAPVIPAAVVLGMFVWFANWIPQTRWQPPEKRTIQAAASPAELAALGREIVRERGCLACHTIEPGAGVKGGGRGPNLADVAQRRAQGVKGGAGNLVDYLVQSLYEPGAYVVEGYANIMPPSSGAPAKLTYEEVVAVVNYLQSLGGTPSVRVGDIARPAGAAAPPAVADIKDPKELLNTQGCLGCHSLEAGKVVLGPSLAATDLKQAAAARKLSVEALLIEGIVDPKASERQGFPSGVMPQDYGARLSAAQLKSLVEFLAGGRKP